MPRDEDGDRQTGDGEREPPDPEQVRRTLAAFGDLLRRLDEEGRLLEAAPLLLTRLGDLRRMLFDYEVRTTGRLMPVEDPVERESRRIVREAIERYEEMVGEWGEGWTPPEEDEEGEGG